jgi:hypothetical protein
MFMLRYLNREKGKKKPLFDLNICSCWCLSYGLYLHRLIVLGLGPGGVINQGIPGVNRSTVADTSTSEKM